MTGSTPLVSVVVLTYNHERYIAQALDGVLGQDAPFSVEVIVTEDCSTDRTADIVRAYAEAWPGRVRTMFSPENLNSNHVLERAFHMAQGRYVALLDGDDYWTRRDKLARQVALLEADASAAMCFHDAALVDGHGNKIGRTSVWGGCPERLGMAEMIAGNHIPTCSVLVRRAALQNLPGWYNDAEYGDWPLWILAAQHGALVFLKDVMAARRIHRSGLWSAQSDIRQTEGCLRMLELLRSAVGPEWQGAVEVSRAGWALRLAFMQGGAAEALRRAVERHGMDDGLRQWFEQLRDWRSPRPWGRRRLRSAGPWALHQLLSKAPWAS